MNSPIWAFEMQMRGCVMVKDTTHCPTAYRNEVKIAPPACMLGSKQDRRFATISRGTPG